MTRALVARKRKIFALFFALAASFGFSWAADIPCTAADLGKVLCTDGSIYATVSEATAAGKTAAAVIAYVDTENGKALALALADESGDMQWETAKTTAAAHTPVVSNGTWTLPTKDEWDNMITAAGGYEALRDGFSSVGGTNMNEDKYWSSTPENTYAWCYYFNYGKWVDGYVDNPCYVRACLAFDIPAAPATDPAKLPGAFTINANGDKIVFSKGNLQATTTDLGANWTWDFAPNQWSLIGNAVANNAIKGNKNVSTNGTVDLFGWSTAATYYGINESWKNDDYAGDFVDWGALMGTEWRTLSRDEWRYIVSNRTDAYKKHGQATVNGVPGYVLLPDAWTLPSGLSFTNSVENYTTNQYDGADWTAMESAGAVFLPAAGVREGTDIYQVNLYGWYWASTPNETDGGKAYYLWFDKSSEGVTEYNRWKSKSVRLVTEAPIPPYEAAIKLINEIPNPVVLTAECKAKIDEARAAYDALSDGDKDLVTNSATLTTAEAAFENVMNIWLSGNCDAILWKDTTLAIRKHAGEGNGAMADYNYMSRAPWYSAHWYDPKPNDIVIKSVKIEEGVTHLGDYAFAWMSEMKTVTIPSSVTTIPEDAFYWSKAVDDIYLTVADPSNLTWALPHSADVQFKPSKATLCHVPADLLTAYQEKFGTLNMTFVGDLDPITPLTPEQQQALDAAKGLINAIPSPVVYTPACKDAIDAARAAYDALTPDMLKQLVSNYATLTAAEATYANLKDVVVVEAKINAIPQPVTLKLATRDSIESARAAYDALTADQKLLVSNYAILEAAEATWAGSINVAPAGALSGKYTINDGGDVIYFAHGNLQYTRENLDADWSTGTFRLAENQYDLIELVKTYPAAYCTDNYGDKTAVGLFGWGTWGEGKTPNLTSSDRTLYTWSTDFSGTLEGTDTWRTLSKDEWVYLLSHNNLSYATVHGVNGLLVAPDGKDIEGKSMTAWVEINDETWTTMQNDGYLFLPACGQRSQLSGANITTGGQGEEVLYYSSTQYNDTYAHNIWYKPGQDPATDDYSNKRQAFGVRLVSAGVNPLDQAQAAKDLIDAIGEVSYPDSKEAIKAAREAVDALGANVSLLDDADITKLTQAETAYAQLLAQAVAAVKAAIDAVPATPLTDATKKLSEYNKVTDARAAYDALSDEEKAAVTNYDKLTAAEEAFAAIGGGTGLNVSTEDIGKVLCADGSLYATKDEATAASKTPVAMIAYVEDSKGLAIALEDESNTMIWSTAITTAAAHTPTVTGGTWKLPSLLEWQQMFVGCGADLTPSETSGNVTDYLGLRDKLSAAGGNGFVEWSYWTTTEWADNPAGYAWDPYFSPEIVKWYKNKKDRDDFYIRAILAFNVVASKALADAQAAKDLIDAIPSPVVVTDDCKAKIDAAREAVTALGENASLLDDVDIAKLAKAEADFALLIKDATAVVDKIDAIGEVTFSADSKGKIVDARNAYDALSDELKPYVSNLATLTAAEAAYEAARPFATVTTVPAAVETLQYTGAAQVLITAGAAEHGTVLYSLDGENYSTELPTAVLAGAYTVYYKVQATDDYKDVAPATVIATIAYNYPDTYSLFGIPEGWRVKVNGTEATVENGAIKNIAKDDRFDVLPTKPEDVKLVEVVPYILDLATATDSVIYLMNGDSITGTANGNISIVIVPDAKVYFKDVNLTNTGSHPAVLCGGNAEMVVVGENSITCTKEGEYGIRAAGAGTTLTISGDKTLLKVTIDPNGGTVNQ